MQILNNKKLTALREETKRLYTDYKAAENIKDQRKIGRKIGKVSQERAKIIMDICNGRLSNSCFSNKNTSFGFNVATDVGLIAIGFNPGSIARSDITGEKRKGIYDGSFVETDRNRPLLESATKRANKL